VRITKDPEEGPELHRALATAQARGVVRQFESLYQLTNALSSIVEPPAPRAKIAEFLRAGAGHGDARYLVALVRPSARLREGTRHALEIKVGERPGIAVLIVRSAADITAVEKRLRDR